MTSWGKKRKNKCRKQIPADSNMHTSSFIQNSLLSLQTDEGIKIVGAREEVEVFNRYFSSVFTVEDLSIMTRKLNTQAHKNGGSTVHRSKCKQLLE
jgi:hypothetical protein